MKDFNTLNDLLEYIDSLSISTYDYDAIMSLLNDCDDTLYYKIIEEIKNSDHTNNLMFSDFSKLFPNNLNIEDSIKTQSKLFNEYLMFRDLNGIDATQNIVSLQNSTISIEKQNQFFSLFNNADNNVLSEYYCNKVLKDILDNPDNIDKILLSANSYIVPMSYDDIILNEYDNKFIEENGITASDMKKIKSLALWHVEQPRPTNTEGDQ